MSASPDAAPEPQRHLGYLIRRAQQRHVAVWQREASADISSVQYAALAVLDRLPGASQRELGDELDLDRSTIADLVARLERAGLVERLQDASDRRRKVLRLTARGAAEHVRLRPGVERVQAALVADLDPDERSVLRALLRRVVGESPRSG
ncbi:MarR family transcriptional regulator [Nocardioides sp. KR10-350]|uniref:MarR family winged helix-turn-helix transcriptional regulator n=1 Tax=Nocardioides cheoyonin TaxID=3156615 RepID=UPI0032B4B013